MNDMLGHATEGLLFMKHGCVFSVHRRMNDMLGHAIPDIVGRFSLDDQSRVGF